MLHTAPRHLPALSLMLDDIGNPKPAALAKTLGVAERTVFRWLADDDAPRAVLLALYWLTTWGRGAVDAQATNDARQYAQLADAYRSENERLRAELARVLAAGDFGTANAPTMVNVDKYRPAPGAAPAAGEVIDLAARRAARQAV
jgi:hypothetical protein